MRIKICGIKRVENAIIAAYYGADGWISSRTKNIIQMTLLTNI